jgi:hypothetical protein
MGADLAARHREQGLDRQGGAKQGCGGADPAAAAQVLEAVDRRATVVTTSSTSAPPRATSAPARTANPLAIASTWVSTTRTGSGARRAATSAAATVPEILPLRCADTTAE